MAKSSANVVHLSDPTPGGNEIISYGEPYRIQVSIEGSADILFHRWNAEAVDEKAAAAKGSKAKKSDDIESYVYRNEEGFICLPGEYLRGAIIGAAKYKQDPRSPRKSAMDLYKAGIVALTSLASLGSKEWDYLDKRRVVVQRNGINRTRPAMRAGWSATFVFLVTLPEYISPQTLNEVIATAGRIGGLGDFRPTYGRFNITSFSVLAE
jgi:hypothetical protein